MSTRFNGPAPKLLEDGVEDIIDEAIKFYRAIILFKNYEIKGMIKSLKLRGCWSNNSLFIGIHFIYDESNRKRVF